MGVSFQCSIPVKLLSILGLEILCSLAVRIGTLSFIVPTVTGI